MPPIKYILPPDLCACGDKDCTIPTGLCHCGCREATAIATRNQYSKRAYKGRYKMFVHGHRGRQVRREIEQPVDGNVRYIPLTNDYVAKVDCEDFERFGRYLYHRDALGYVVRHREDGSRVKIHREIMNAPRHLKVDHKNGDPLDNRRCNLRLCNSRQNAWNHKIASNNTSGVTGVFQIKKSGRWLAHITVNRVKIRLGNFILKEDAIRARREAELRYFGEFARQQ